MSDAAQPSIFMSFEGVNGEVDLPVDAVPAGPGQKWTPLLACRFSAEVNVRGRAMSGGSSTKVDFGGDAPPVLITKRSDASTVGLMREVLAGKAYRSAVIVFVRTDTDGPTEYLRYELRGCSLVSFEFAGFANDRATESFGILYKQMSVITFAGGHGAKGAQSSATLLNGG
jgi:type VI protein secretion system component Hcp